MASSLWQHRDFMLLWIGQSVSRVGDQFTAFALPVLAVYALNPTAIEMGYLAAAATLPFLLFGLVVGVWLDRMRKRPVLIVGDLTRGILVGTIAVLGFGGLLRMTYLYVFAFVIGVLTVFFDIAYQSYVPVLVPRQTLTDANSKLETTSSMALVGGPSAAGVVVEFLSAPAAMLFDAFSFFFSTGYLLRIRHREEPLRTPRTTSPAPDREKGLRAVLRRHLPRTQRREAQTTSRSASLATDLREGLRVVLGEPRLRMIAGCTGTSNFFSSAFYALFFLYALDELHFSALVLGIVQAVGASGGVVAALTTTRITQRVGVGWSIILGAAISGFAMLPVALVQGILAAPVIAACLGATFFGILLYNIDQVSFRQTIVPIRLQGRLNATMRTIVWGTLPLGGLAGGFLGEAVGLQWGLFLSTVGGAFAFLWVLFSPIRDVVTMPEPAA